MTSNVQTAFHALSKFTTVGPFLLYPIACYWLFRFGIDDQWYGWIGAVLSTAYTVVAAFLTVAYLPAIDTMYWDYLNAEASKVGSFENELDSDPLPEDFNDWGYLFEAALEI